MFNTDRPVLYYVHDPMCSWCWAFRPVWLQLQDKINHKVIILYLLGGLAPDTEDPMPEAMRQRIQQTWRNIQAAVPGTEFNFDFWQQCEAKRSTYPSCRAMLATRQQAPEKEPDMLYAIQRAYYCESRNPSDIDVLIQLAGEIGLDTQRFESDLRSEMVNQLLLSEISTSREMGVYSFPSLVLNLGKSYTSLDIDYTSCITTIAQIDVLLANSTKC